VSQKDLLKNFLNLQMEYSLNIFGIFWNKQSLSTTPRRQVWVLVVCLDPKMEINGKQQKRKIIPPFLIIESFGNHCS